MVNLLKTSELTPTNRQHAVFLPAQKDHTKQREKHWDVCVGLNVTFHSRGNLNIGEHFAKNVSETFALFDIFYYLFYVVSHATGVSNLAATSEEFQQMYKSGSFTC